VRRTLSPWRPLRPSEIALAFAVGTTFDFLTVYSRSLNFSVTALELIITFHFVSLQETPSPLFSRLGQFLPSAPHFAF
jgi:hypothetical protein